MIEFDFFLVGNMTALMAIGLAVSFMMPRRDKWVRRYFIVLFLVLTMLIVVILADLILMRVHGYSLTAEKIVWGVEASFVSIPLIMFTRYLLHCCGEDVKKSPLFISTLVLFTAYNVIIVLSSFISGFYYTDQYTYFERGPLYWLLTAPIIVIMILNLIGVIRRRKHLSRRSFIAFLVHLAPFLAATVYHTVFIDFMVLDIGLVISVIAMFAIIFADQIDQSISQERQIAKQRASIAVLQMRPHFISNTLMSIYYLCADKPEKAQQVTLDFATYLRKNFTAIASDQTIPFSEELEHTRAYLAVEQAQFEDQLFVDYFTVYKQFRLPPLTLQPIVENAVKHAMDPERDPLHIVIRTRDTGSASEIVVEDDGVGYTPSDDREPHIALENIRERLKLMCGGEMTIEPRQGGGTTVRITIPLEKE